MRRSLVALVALVAAACATPRTEVLVVTDTDLRGPGGIDTIFATVTSPTGEMQTSMATLGPGQPSLPRTLGLVWDGGRLGPYTVRLTGNAGGAMLVSRAATFSFQEQRTLVLRMDLLARCQGVTCGGEQTCGETGCRAIAVEPAELQEWTGALPALDIDAATPPIDAGMMSIDSGGPVDATPGTDACVPASETCNMADDDCDGMVDETFALATDVMNCGACGNACDFQNATGECTAGTCTIGACNAGFDDCNGSGDDGCEVELATTPTDCGACGMRCAPPDRDCCAGMCGRDCL
ncbi:MAG: hypothetical protein M3Y87_02815 [Myxococcota bacterium]|nr:hypothetical protein [Myxococcota bacterium]